MGAHHHQEQASSRTTQTKMERSMLNITYRDRKINIWVREKTKVTDVIEQVRRRKWTWAVQVSRIQDNHMETIRKKINQRKAPETLERRTRRLLEAGYHMSEDSAR